ncbi:hypothetical protein CL630_01060 [bacterium]|mgnify:CR=1 FL=1|nr:hypothetical protein [bacterium]|tara:strand:- start:22154 stop:22540 length:387 start_codon:yes stop_codon:yes gene_type:complete
MLALKKTTIAKGDFDELIDSCCLEPNRVKQVFAGKPYGNREARYPFFVPHQGIVGTSSVPVHFSNRELLCRFLSLPFSEQKRLLAGILEAMNNNDVYEIHFGVQWSPSKIRTINVHTSSIEGLYFDLL